MQEPVAFAALVEALIRRGEAKSCTKDDHPARILESYVMWRLEYDVLGIGYDAISDSDRAEITALHPRPDFKRRILEAFTEGIAPRPESTFGNENADVLEHFKPGFRRGDFVEIILNSPWTE